MYNTRENKEPWNGYCTGINWGRNTIAKAPTVDAVEVVHGRWIVLARFFDNTICTQCSVCGEEYTYESYAKYNYCPNCGAKMDGDGDEKINIRWRKEMED